MNAAPPTSEPTPPEPATAAQRGDERATAELRGWLDTIERARTISPCELPRPLVPKPCAPSRRGVVSSR